MSRPLLSDGVWQECIRAHLLRRGRQTTGGTHIPYRNCKLTLLLREALESTSGGGLSSEKERDAGAQLSGDHPRPVVLLLCHVNPCRSSMEHSLNTLDFGTSMMSVSRAEKEQKAWKGPDAWSVAQVQQFIATLADGKVRHLVDVFAITGKVLSHEWIGHVERRVLAAGGTVEEAHLIYDAFYDARKAYRVRPGPRETTAASRAVTSRGNFGREGGRVGMWQISASMAVEESCGDGEDVSVGAPGGSNTTGGHIKSVSTLRQEQRGQFVANMQRSADVVYCSRPPDADEQGADSTDTLHASNPSSTRDPEYPTFSTS